MAHEAGLIIKSDMSRLRSDLSEICGFGGRLSGTRSEAAAIAWLKAAAIDALGVPCLEHEIRYQGWRAVAASLCAQDGENLDCHPLVRSLPTPEEGLTAEVLDLGRGVAEDFAGKREALKGRIALFSHEVMFSPDTFHRREKLRLAREAGAVAALVASNVEGELVTGSSRAEGQPGIPAMGITPEAAERLRRADGSPVRARMIIATEEAPATSKNLILDLPGESGQWVVLSAHVDGHDLAESAMDNASGVAACLEVARNMRMTGPHRHGLRLAFFSVEEWGLTGSAQYLDGLTEDGRASILLNVNLDTVAGGARLTALTSGFGNLSDFVRDKSMISGHDITVHEPLQRNSDHANFARHGIPAMRILSGFDEPKSDVRYVLTGGDRRDKIRDADMARAADLSAALTRAALNGDEAIFRAWRK